MIESQSFLLQCPSSLMQSIIICLKQLLVQSASVEQGGSLFNLRTVPTISVSDYLARMFKYMNSSTSSFVYALILIDRIQEYNPGLLLTGKNVHRLLLVANVVSAKYLDDFFYKNSFYANIGGVSLTVLNELQAEFMALIGFNAHVEEETFLSYLDRLDLFAEVNRGIGDEKQNLMAEKVPLERKNELKSKDGNMKQNNNKGMVHCRSVRGRVKPDYSVRTNASQL